MRAVSILLPATLVVAALGGGAGSATPRVTVTAGPALQLKSQNYGPGAVDGLTHDLARTVGATLSRSGGANAPSQLQLVLEDASPSRPLGSTRTPSGPEGGVSLGGAWIDGFVIAADGKKTPLGFSFYQAGLTASVQPGEWTDAHHAFDMLAADLAKGRVPQQNAPGAKPPNSEAHYPN